MDDSQREEIIKTARTLWDGGDPFATIFNSMNPAPVIPLSVLLRDVWETVTDS